MIMDEKNNPGMPLIPPRRALSPSRLLLAVGYLALVGFTYCYFRQPPAAVPWAGAPQSPSSPARNRVAVDEATRELVPLEAHIMSKCPDAKV